MSTPILRRLARAYSNGLIDRKQYIRERRQLIDGIVNGNVEVVPYLSPPATPNPDLERTFSDGDNSLDLPGLINKDPQPPPKSKLPLIIAGILILMAVTILLWLVMAPQSEPTDPARTGDGKTGFRIVREID